MSTREFHGVVPVRFALEKSLNVATARLGQEVGIRRVVDVARRLGVTSPLPEVPSLALGSGEVSPMEIARAYATLANGGIRPEMQAIEDLVDARGETLERRKLKFERVLDPGTAFLATSMLQGVAERGTARGVRATGLRGPIAAKTGTSDSEVDLWFVGFTPELLTVVWVGLDDNQALGLSGAQAALPIWLSFMQRALAGRGDHAFDVPDNINFVDIDRDTGATALPGCLRTYHEAFLVGTEPHELCELHRF